VRGCVTHNHGKGFHGVSHVRVQILRKPAADYLPRCGGRPARAQRAAPDFILYLLRPASVATHALCPALRRANSR
jgi:hypothetical protein